MKNGQHGFVDLIPGSFALVGPKDKFSDSRQIALFEEIMTWFFEYVPHSATWQTDQYVEQSIGVERLSELQCKDLFKHLRTYILYAGYDFIFVPRDDGQWMITVMILKDARLPVLVR
ncbi:MAG: hypothetical protein PHG25_03625 [Candidatus Pacebacteria bacterium]|nr:hypothetical protein [Candidatus Paceibacterota bacterium]